MSHYEYRPSLIADLLPDSANKARWQMLAAKIWNYFNPWFWFIVIIPTIVAFAYFFLIASDLYMSEARFIVRSQSQQMPSLLGSILQTTGMQTSNNDAYAVESFMSSRAAVRVLENDRQLRDIFARPEGDLVTRFPNLVSGSSFEQLYKHYLRFVDITLDSSSGVTTLNVEAYRPQDAQAIAQGLLLASEKLVNQLNARAEADELDQARRHVEEAEQKLFNIQQQLAVYRNREQLLDPKLTTGSIYATLGSLMTARASTATQLAEMTKDSPGNPSIPGLKARLAALSGQLDDAKKDVTGGSDSVAGKLGGYERLALDEDLASKILASATEALETSQLQAQSKHLYIEHIADPSLPDYAIYPRRLIDFSMSLVAVLVIYGIAWLLLASVREHGSA